MHTYFSDESSLQKRDCKDNKTCQTWTILQGSTIHYKNL